MKRVNCGNDQSLAWVLQYLGICLAVLNGGSYGSLNNSLQHIFCNCSSALLYYTLIFRML